MKWNWKRKRGKRKRKGKGSNLCRFTSTGATGATKSSASSF
jgi:hypothetical protein